MKRSSLILVLKRAVVLVALISWSNPCWSNVCDLKQGRTMVLGYTENDPSLIVFHKNFVIYKIKAAFFFNGAKNPNPLSKPGPRRASEPGPSRTPGSSWVSEPAPSRASQPQISGRLPIGANERRIEVDFKSNGEIESAIVFTPKQSTRYSGAQLNDPKVRVHLHRIEKYKKDWQNALGCCATDYRSGKIGEEIMNISSQCSLGNVEDPW